jgi:hypothetical protein
MKEAMIDSLSSKNNWQNHLEGREAVELQEYLDVYKNKLLQESEKPMKIDNVFLFVSYTSQMEKLKEMGAKDVFVVPPGFLESADKSLGLSGALAAWAASHPIKSEKVPSEMSTEQWHSFLSSRFAQYSRWRSYGGSNSLAVFVIVVVFE